MFAVYTCARKLTETAMATDVIMPEMGESVTEATITKWLVGVGDKVEQEQPLFEVSTDKVDAEIPSPAAGILLEIKYDEGATVSANEVVASIGTPGEHPVGAAAPDRPIVERIEPEIVVPASPPTSPPAGDEPASAEVELVERVRKFSSPVVRKMAVAEGVDLEAVEGSGIHGRVTKKDMVAYLEKADSRLEKMDSRPVAAPPAPQTQAVSSMRREPGEFHIAPYLDGDNVAIEPMSNIRRLTAAHMVYSKATSAHVTSVFHIDLSRVARVRKRAKEGFLQTHGTKLTFMPFIFTAVANALVAHPKLNAAIDGTNIVFKKDINIGMAVALDWGLLVPVVRHADRLNLVGLAKTANDLADRARAKKLSPDEVQGGTFTVTNPGVYGSLYGTPIINQPQVAILGIGTIEKRPVVESDDEGNDTIAIKTMSYFAITYDHRLVDGADADAFMNDLKQTLAEET
ncbi:MAG: 2-oxoglutarate dehydrogenase, E2 component, dihydrolipoamide succinyltransferase, partial [Thermoanaerobaculia bacterium]